MTYLKLASILCKDSSKEVGVLEMRVNLRGGVILLTVLAARISRACDGSDIGGFGRHSELGISC